MPYNANIPQATDAISDSQTDLLNNFQSINTFVNVNHVAFDDPNQGKHKFLQMPQQGAAPATAIGETALVTLASAFTTTQGAGAPTLVYRNENNGVATEMTSGLLASPGWAFLPCGLLIKWGTLVVNATGVGTAGLNGAGIPSFGTSILAINCQVICRNGNLDPNIIVYPNSTTTTLSTLGYNTVTRYNAGAAVLPASVYYYVIGF